jgi:hypothetical protein
VDVIWRKTWFDLWHNKVRTALAVLSIAAGVFALGMSCDPDLVYLMARDSQRLGETEPALAQLGGI